MLFNGYLKKWTNYVGMWKERYFVLKDDILTYYIEKGMPPKGKIHLSISELQDNNNEPLFFTINNGISNIYLQAFSIEQKNNFVQAFNQAKQLIQNAKKKEDLFYNSNNNQMKSIQKDIKLLKEKLQIINNNECISLLNQLESIVKKEITVEGTALVSKSKASNTKISRELTSSTFTIPNYTSKITLNNDDYYSVDEEGNESDSSYIKTIIDNETDYNPSIMNENNKIELLIEDSFNQSYPQRNHLPVKRKVISFSVWSLIKDAIGKDLSKITFPAYINEPLSMTQRLCENFQYHSLLAKASQSTYDPYLQLAYIACFSIGAYAIPQNRKLKFFNPLLGETYEYLSPSFKYFAEQVSHHPPITACYVIGKEGYEVFGNTLCQSKMGFSNGEMLLEFKPLSSFFIKFKDDTVITFKRPSCGVRNLIGNNYIDCFGEFQCVNQKTNDFAEIIIDPSYKGITDTDNVKGEIKNKEGDIQYTLKGNWKNTIDLYDNQGRKIKTIFEAAKTRGEEEYYFSDFDIQLNYITEEMKKKLPCTDSRLRPDLRALENQDYELAKSEKLRLEIEQRKRKKEMDENGTQYTPYYFDEVYDDITGELVYTYKRDYWKDIEVGDLKHLKTIY